MIQDLAKRRLKNAQDKALKMQKLLSDEISAEEEAFMNGLDEADTGAVSGSGSFLL